MHADNILTPADRASIAEASKLMLAVMVNLKGRVSNALAACRLVLRVATGEMVAAGHNTIANKPTCGDANCFTSLPCKCAGKPLALPVANGAS